MSRVKTLLSNTLIFTISEFASKLLVFFMLPVYTRAMTTGDFGASDLIVSTVGLLLPVLTLSIAFGALRFAMSINADNSQVFTFGLKVILAGFGIMLLFYPVWTQIVVIKDHLLLFYITYITSALNNYFNQFARGINKIKLVGICGVLSTVIVVTSNLVLLLVFRLGVIGFLVSFILSYIASSTILVIAGKMYQYLTTTPCEKSLRKDMLSYSIPFAPHSLSWWLNNTANRYIIAAFCGVSQVGLFAVAARIPTILTTFQGIFYQAWYLSAITEYEKEDKIEFFSKVYKLYSLTMVLICSVLILLVRLIAGILFSVDFYSAWQFIPLLLVSVVFGALSGFFGSVYSSSNNTRMLFVTTFAGAVVTVGLNLLLVPVWGPMGASAASVVGYAMVWMIRLIDSSKYVKLQISVSKDCSCYLLLILQAIMMIYFTADSGYMSSVVVLAMIVFLNIEDLRSYKHMVVSLMKIISTKLFNFIG